MTGKRRRDGQDINVHVERVLVRSIEVVRCERPGDLRLTTRHGDPDTREHVVHEHVVGVALADNVADCDFVRFIVRRTAYHT